MDLIEISMVVGFIAIISYAVKKKKRKDKNKKQPAPEVVPVVDNRPKESGLPERRIIYMDDSILSLTEKNGGDFNAVNDAAFIIALFQHYGARPLAFGATCVAENRGVNGEIFRQMLDAGGFAEVPVKVGSPTYTPERSELSQYIVEESKKGKLTICIGGPCNDLVQAIKDGANVNNIELSAILAGTWNETTNLSTHDIAMENTRFVYSRIQNIVDVTWYLEFLTARKGVQYNEDWIKEWRAKNEMFNIGFGDFVTARNRELNISYKRNPMRVADFMTVDRVFGGKSRADDFEDVIDRVENGLNLINDRVK